MQKAFWRCHWEKNTCILATIIVWFTTGIWHGAAWNFIVWGLLNCLVILISQECIPLYNRFHSRFNVINTFGTAYFRWLEPLANELFTYLRLL